MLDELDREQHNCINREAAVLNYAYYLTMMQPTVDSENPSRNILLALFENHQKMSHLRLNNFLHVLILLGNFYGKIVLLDKNLCSREFLL